MEPCPERRRMTSERLETGQIVVDTRLKADIIGYTQEYAALVRSWIDSEDTYFNLCRSREFPPPEDIMYSWQRTNVLSKLLLAGGKPVAYGELWARPAELAVELAHLLVDPALRGKGYGTALIEHLFQSAARRPGVAKVLLNLFAENKHTLNCYLKAGFQIVGTTKHLPGLRMIRLAR